MFWLQRLMRRRATPEALLNEGLGLAMDWGDNWLAPINSRLRERHRYLSSSELEEFNVACQGAMLLGHKSVHALLREGTNPSLESLASVVQAKYPWVSQENLARLLNQSIYYAAKMGGHAGET